MRFGASIRRMKVLKTQKLPGATPQVPQCFVVGEHQVVSIDFAPFQGVKRNRKKGSVDCFRGILTSASALQASSISQRVQIPSCSGFIDPKRRDRCDLEGLIP